MKGLTEAGPLFLRHFDFYGRLAYTAEGMRRGQILGRQKIEMRMKS